MNPIRFLVVAGLLASWTAAAQEEETSLSLNVMARLGHHDGQTLVGEADWQASASRKVENGRPVSLLLEKPNLQINTRFTPYLQDGGKVLVVVQTEARRVDDEGRFRGVFSTVQTATVGVDEPMLFFPFGKREGEASLALEFMVVRE